MEKKKTQRIIGILVLIALVIMIAPLLLGKNNGPVAEATDIKAPPFPDQPKKMALGDITPSETAAPAPAATVSTAPTAPIATASTTPAAMTATTAPTATAMASTATTAAAPATTNTSTTSNPTTTISPPADKVATSDQASANEAAPTIIYERPKETSQVTPIPDTIPTKTSKPNQIADSSPKETNDVEKEIIIKPTAVIEKVRKTNNVKSVMAKNKYTTSVEQTNKLKAAWAIQMGSFKVKQNAINFVNKLRASGYKAFIRDVKTAKGNKVTGVYIGPEFKQASAVKLAFDVNHHLNLNGYVIAYQPFEI